MCFVAGGGFNVLRGYVQQYATKIPRGCRPVRLGGRLGAVLIVFSAVAEADRAEDN